jgi:hypothetical protein
MYALNDIPIASARARPAARRVLRLLEVFDLTVQIPAGLLQIDDGCALLPAAKHILHYIPETKTKREIFDHTHYVISLAIRRIY